MEGLNSQQLLALEQLPTEDLCAIISQLDMRGITTLTRTSRRLREAAEFCVISLRPNEILTSSFVLSLPHLSHVEGIVRFNTFEEIQMLSHRLRGPLLLQSSGINKSIGEFQKIFLNLLLVRTQLYPRSPFRGESPGSELVVGYDPTSQRLILHLWNLLAGVEFLGDVPLFQRLPIRSLDISSPDIHAHLPDALSNFDLQELIIPTESSSWFVTYVYHRIKASLPIFLTRLVFVSPSLYRSYPSIAILRSHVKYLRSQGVTSLPSMTEIIGIGGGDLNDILPFFPNLRKVGVVLNQGQTIEDVAAEWGTAERGITLEAV